MLALFRALMPKEDRFFEMFERHSRVLVSGAEALQSLFAEGADVPRWCAEVKTHEKAADAITA